MENPNLKDDINSSFNGKKRGNEFLRKDDNDESSKYSNTESENKSNNTLNLNPINSMNFLQPLSSSNNKAENSITGSSNSKPNNTTTAVPNNGSTNSNIPNGFPPHIPFMNGMNRGNFMYPPHMQNLTMFNQQFNNNLMFPFPNGGIPSHPNQNPNSTPAMPIKPTTLNQPKLINPNNKNPPPAKIWDAAANIKKIPKEYLDKKEIVKAPLKSILKKKTANNKSPEKNRKPIKWVEEEEIERFKIFKLTDEPNCPEITEDEYMRIQEEILSNPNYRFVEDMRLREVRMENENMHRARDKDKLAKEILMKMIPQAFMKPFRELNKGDDFDLADSTDSKEKLKIKQSCSNNLAVNYYKDSDIPSCPELKEEKMFDFCDEKILKIENELAKEKEEEVSENKEKEGLTEKEKQEIMNLIQEFVREHKIPHEISLLLQSKITSMKKFNVQDLPEIYSGIINEYSNSKFENKNNPNIPLNYSSFNFPFNNFNNNYYYNNNSYNVSNFNHSFSNNTPNNNANINPNNMNNNKFYKNYKENSFTSLHPKMDVSRYKTKPCKKYHSMGLDECTREDKCFFIHDPRYKGRDIPNFNPDDYREEQVNKPEFLKTMINNTNNSNTTPKQNINQVFDYSTSNISNNTTTNSMNSFSNNTNIYCNQGATSNSYFYSNNITDEANKNSNPNLNIKFPGPQGSIGMQNHPTTPSTPLGNKN